MDKSLPVAPKKYRFGICAMRKKVEASPMKMLMERIRPFVEIVIFEEETILHAPIEEWPIVDVLMGWYSDGYPLDKAISYVELRKPYSLNDLSMQKISCGNNNNNNNDNIFWFLY
ncbi:uncharacterized protein [Blastocystis hominis]|uniref:VIP1 N-terminal domain-containing protein n=1 Tax=Blastocystis hominis TaxID=12968 RepID=D8MBM4_BLAHO|nr:uncharacterized protein [Blastocystis hominis]CBK25463.2 unnamed protein product [Blastocystis hominis]|eukprot:XP_012899511.1 uncharacterized protein [Blastocystis hominis]